jgi:hypothetical protein
MPEAQILKVRGLIQQAEALVVRQRQIIDEPGGHSLLKDLARKYLAELESDLVGQRNRLSSLLAI